MLTHPQIHEEKNLDEFNHHKQVNDIPLTQSSAVTLSFLHTSSWILHGVCSANYLVLSLNLMHMSLCFSNSSFLLQLG